MKVKTEQLKGGYDAVIVGSGPAGAGAARALEGSGLNVVIIEKKTLPRYKMCSGILFPSSVKFINDYFGEIPGHVFCQPSVVKGNRVFINFDSEMIDVPFTSFDSRDDLPQTGYNVLRRELDFWLCSQSDASIVDDCLFKNCTDKDGEIFIEVRHSGYDVEIKTKYLIGADGPQSSVRRAVSPEFDKGIEWVPNYEELYEGEIGLGPGYLYIFLDRRITGYIATVFQKTNEIHVVTGVKKGESSRGYHKRFVARLEEKHGLRIGMTLATHGIVLNDMTARRNYHLGKGNVIICGEAAGILRGAEGITSALVTGIAAGESILRSIDSGNQPVDIFSTHEALLAEIQQCEMFHSTMESILGYNIFTRD
jgi:flavin-dependent dehydrogenase